MDVAQRECEPTYVYDLVSKIYGESKWNQKLNATASMFVIIKKKTYQTIVKRNWNLQTTKTRQIKQNSELRKVTMIICDSFCMLDVHIFCLEFKQWEGNCSIRLFCKRSS